MAILKQRKKSTGEASNWFGYFQNYKPERKLIKIYNVCCLRCKKVEEEMCRIGTLDFCIPCGIKEFPNGDDEAKYKFWLEIKHDTIESKSW